MLAALELCARPAHRDEVEVVHRAYLLYSSSPRGVTFDRRDMLMTKYRLTQDQADAMNSGMERTAAVEGLDLLTRDATRYRTYFPSVVVTAPQP